MAVKYGFYGDENMSLLWSEKYGFYGQRNIGLLWR